MARLNPPHHAPSTRPQLHHSPLACEDVNMRWSTPWLVLLGSRRALLNAAAHWPTALLVGALLVLSAGFARNYDGVDLRSEPWWLIGPYAASFITSLLLFGLYRSIFGKRLPVRVFPAFLAIYWLTAPLAWLYAVPYEMFLTPRQAIDANAWTLGVVALWRVASVARVAQVFLKCSWWRAFLIDLWFGVAIIWVASFFAPAPVLDVMGGLRLTDEERARSSLVFATRFLGFFATCVLGIAALVAANGINRRPGDADPSSTPLEPLRALVALPKRRPIRMRPIIIASLCAAAWIPLLIWQQPKQAAAHHIDTLARNHSFNDVLAALSKLQPSDLPVAWHVPVGDPGDRPADQLRSMQLAVTRAPFTVPTWIRRAYVDQTGLRLRQLHYFGHAPTWVEQLENAHPYWLEDNERSPGDTTRAELEWMLQQRDCLSMREIAALEHVFGRKE